MHLPLRRIACCGTSSGQHGVARMRPCLARHVATRVSTLATDTQRSGCAAAFGLALGAISVFGGSRTARRRIGSERTLCETHSSSATLEKTLRPKYPVGVTSVQFDDTARSDPDGGPRCLQTEIWYPAGDEARCLQPNKYSEFLARGVDGEYIARAEDDDAIGGYRKGLSIKELDENWENLAKRDARMRVPSQGNTWPVVVFSHGSGAFRASYVYFTEFLASQGFVVVACDHVGSSRYTIINGRVVKGGGVRGETSQQDRPLDVTFLLNSMERLHLGADSRFAGRLDMSRCAVTGMSFGGWTAAKVVDFQDPRVKAAVLQCPSLGRGDLQNPVNIPVMVMLGVEDTVIGAKGNSAGQEYFEKASAAKYLLEIIKGGHVTFTSCEQYNAAYGNGIGPSRSLTRPGETYEPLSPERAHDVINSYTFAFLDLHLNGNNDQRAFLEQNNFEGEARYRFVH